MSVVTAPPAKWTQYTVTNRHEKRAELVCTVCHAKKIKCDLQTRRRHGLSDCSFCRKSGRQCQARSPKRRKRATTKDQNGVAAPAENADAVPNDFSSVLSIACSGQNELPHQPTPSSNNVVGDSRADGIPELSQFDYPNGAQSSANQRRLARASFHSEPEESHKGDVDIGFLRVYAREEFEDACNQALSARPKQPSPALDSQTSAELLHIFADTYFDECYAWCPILDRETIHDELARAPILQNALASLGSHVRPPMLPCAGAAVHYNRARRMFYEDEEPDTLTCLKSILLFYWWAPRSPAMVHRHSSWWWTSVVIRHAQQMSIHRNSSPPAYDVETSRAWRRVWWTAFARERLTALCQSKPVMINPKDCNIPDISLDDFPPEVRGQRKPFVFISWVRLTAIMGRIAQLLGRSGTDSAAATSSSPVHAAELVAWVNSLPQQCRIYLIPRNLSAFDKDTYQLHIPYLIAVIVLHLKRTPEPGGMPRALPPAMFAASCVARIFKDILAKGDTRFLMPITSWYCGVTFIALLAASQEPSLAESAKMDLDLVILMCDQLRRMWASSQVVFAGLERLREKAGSDTGLSAHTPTGSTHRSEFTNGSTDASLHHGGVVDWMEYFPFATNETSKLTEQLLSLRQNDNYYSNTFLPPSSMLDQWDWLDGLNTTEIAFDDDMFTSWTG